MDQPLTPDQILESLRVAPEAPEPEAGLTPRAFRTAGGLFLLYELFDWSLSGVPALGFVFRAAAMLALLGAGVVIAGRFQETQRKTQEALARSKGMVMGALDALAAPTVVLNEYGVITAVNRAWREFLDANGAGDSTYEVGANFFQSKFLLASAREKHVLALHNGFRRVLSGDRKEFSMEYAADGKDGEEWFLARVTGSFQDNRKWVAVTHENVTAKKKAEKEVEQLQAKQREQARRDPLTGLGNRLQLQEDLEVMEARLERYGHAYSIVLIDVDHLGKYNDRYGHVRGDEVLETVAQTIKALARKGDTAYRYDGEEFMLILPAQSGRDAAVAAERICKGVEMLEIPHLLNVPGGVVTVSAGVSSVEHGECKTVEGLLEEADDALYMAKQSGRNRAYAHKPSTFAAVAA